MMKRIKYLSPYIMLQLACQDFKIWVNAKNKLEILLNTNFKHKKVDFDGNEFHSMREV